MAGYVYGFCAKGVVVLVLSENGDDEVEMDGRHCLRETGIVVDDEEMGARKYYLARYLTISYDGLGEMNIRYEHYCG